MSEKRKDERELGPRHLNPDIPIWERQDQETEAAYASFLKYRDMERRSLKATGGTALRWSRMWSWQQRVLEWDRHIARQDAEAMVKYQVEMNERHRASARVAQSKVIQWLQSLDPKKMSPSEAARWFELAVRVERESANAALAAGDQHDATRDAVDDALAGLSFSDLLGKGREALPDLSDMDEAEAAEVLYRTMKKGQGGGTR